MRSLVIYESMCGNTRDVAIAIGEGLVACGPVDVVEVCAATREPSPDVDLLVVGGPTHAFGLSRGATRADSAKRLGSPPVSSMIGLREWLGATAAARHRSAAAAFDTKIDKPVPGSATHRAQTILRRLGYRNLIAPESFRVTDTTGPLRQGELDQVRDWGARLGDGLVRTPSAPRAESRS